LIYSDLLQVETVKWNIPMNMISNQGKIEDNSDKFSSHQKYYVEEYMSSILWDDQRIQSVTLFNRILEVCF